MRLDNSIIPGQLPRLSRVLRCQAIIRRDASAMHLRLASGQLLEMGYRCVSAAHVPADRLAGPVLGKPQ